MDATYKDEKVSIAYHKTHPYLVDSLVLLVENQALTIQNERSATFAPLNAN